MEAHAASHAAAREQVDILLVDDEKLFTSTLADILEAYGYSVATAPDGTAALDMLPRVRPRLVFLDLSMPGPSGEEVCCRILSRRQAPAVFVVTAVASDDQVDNLRRMGARGILFKPVPIADLLAIAEGVCTRPAAGTGPVGRGRVGRPRPRNQGGTNLWQEASQ